MRTDETARALHMHPNTLRHRLRRFEEATGADLDRATDLLRAVVGARAPPPRNALTALAPGDTVDPCGRTATTTS